MTNAAVLQVKLRTLNGSRAILCIAADTRRPDSSMMIYTLHASGLPITQLGNVHVTQSELLVTYFLLSAQIVFPRTTELHSIITERQRR